MNINICVILKTFGHDGMTRAYMEYELDVCVMSHDAALTSKSRLARHAVTDGQVHVGPVPGIAQV